MTKRVEWIDAARGLCTICVMMTHLNICPDIMRSIFTPFYLSCFFFLSGYVYNPNKYSSIKTLIKEKAKTLLLPAIILSIIIIVTGHIFSFHQHDNIIDDFWMTIVQIRNKGDQLWYLYCLFVSFIPFYLYAKMPICKALILSSFLSLLSLAYLKYFPGELFPWGSNNLPWHIETALISSFFMYLGFAYRNRYEAKHKLNCYIRTLLMIIYLASVISIYLVKKTVIGIDHYNISIVVWYVLSITGVILCVEYSKVYIFRFRLMQYIGANSLLYYALHGKIESIIWNGLIRVVPKFTNAVSESTFLACILCIIIICIVSLVLMPICNLINKYIPWLAGKRRKQYNG